MSYFCYQYLLNSFTGDWCLRDCINYNLFQYQYSTFSNPCSDFFLWCLFVWMLTCIAILCAFWLLPLGFFFSLVAHLFKNSGILPIMFFVALSLFPKMDIHCSIVWHLLLFSWNNILLKMTFISLHMINFVIKEELKTEGAFWLQIFSPC